MRILKGRGCDSDGNPSNMTPDEVRAVQTIVTKTVENEEHIKKIMEQQVVLQKKVDAILKRLTGNVTNEARSLTPSS